MKLSENAISSLLDFFLIWIIDVSLFYTSDMCADVAWTTYHSLLCSGPFSHCKNIDALVSFKEFADGMLCFVHIIFRNFMNSS